ncbi:putative hydrolase (metallo-beta-lactamase superfamily) [Sphaerochaeta pleomorpha str. Grapes]|uniref:Putative hydrolase (Metallo-beta-lactamase superfamily) n=1 Tax=Sphaerochaeta pleomorpha (strain ATCC BAA-1885 / DSM 22778 / Grapes) TaxID=158190 RepID=G8QRD0_SPHPG|nr:MBL fold metallo-hydrolase [Sphaerochaeta pleomorpha]AEV28783.1 putative hydrolase (metallo-beta-lactamase superfamily) [Sphaerochaeta pleomorpha str. Grapes]
MKKTLKIQFFLLIMLLLPLLAFGAGNQNVFTRDAGKFNLYFLDLEVSAEATDKSGDSTVLISPDGKVMLLDCGHPESGRQVVDALHALGIEKIDYFVASHPHIDHIGGFPEIAENFPIGKVYRTALEYPTDIYRRFVSAISEKNIPVEMLSEGDAFSFGDQISVEVFNPSLEITYPSNYPDNSTQFVNNTSLALKFSYGESTAWFSGDLYVPQERVLVMKYGEALQSDVAKANHHGGDTSNSLKWIKNLKATVVVAMHDDVSSMTVYNNYKKYGAAYHLTRNDGNVKVSMDEKKNYTVVDEKESWMN